MSLIEKVLIILAALMPFVALVLFLPKIIKKKKSKQPKSTKKEKPKNLEQKPENTVSASTQPPKKPNTVSNKMSTMGHANDFMSYAQKKNERVTAPKRNFPSPTFSDLDFYSPSMGGNSKTQSISDEIKALSPQLKALILSGALERKDFDD